jgi:hypothetical protein
MRSPDAAGPGKVVIQEPDSRMGSQILNPRNDLVNHSPDGFQWGYEGSGPAQLALAILANFLTDDSRAVRLHQKFKKDVIAQIKSDHFEITGAFIEKWVQETQS